MYRDERKFYDREEAGRREHKSAEWGARGKEEVKGNVIYSTSR